MPQVERIFDPEAQELYYRLKEKFGNDSSIAKALGIPRKTLSDWFQKGFTASQKWHRTKIILRSGLLE